MDAPERIWLDIDDVRNRWRLEPSEGGTGFVRSDLYARLAAENERLRAALTRQVENVEHWMETGEPAGPEESRSVYGQMRAALTGGSDGE